jgi:hypothetical protein
MRFQPRHVVAIVASVCAAAVLAPVGVMAATGTLVNITDPYSSARQARVGASGTLFGETRAGVTSKAFNMAVDNVVDLSLHKLTEAVAPNRLAITEVTLATRATDNGYTTQVDLAGWVRTTGTNPCGGQGWTKTMLRRVSVKTNETVQLLFSGPPLILPVPATGQHVCFTFAITQLPNGVVLDAGGTGYAFTV